MTMIFNNFIIKCLCVHFARSLTLGSLAYAMNHRIAPAPDWEFAKYAIEPNRSFEDKFEFGCNGKPLYIDGPYDAELNLFDRFIKQQGN